MANDKRLAKQLRLIDVYAISTGATLSAGFFLLPGLAFEIAGPAMVLAYVLAALPMVPAMFSVVELATAMPRAGGVYYFLDRSLGPLMGMVGGIGTWLALILKVAFALVGMGAYLRIFFPGLPITPVAVGLALALGVLNAFGTKKSGRFQVILVAGLLGALGGLLVGGLPKLDPGHFEGMLEVGSSAILATAGFVYISYVGVTKVASLSEEVQDPERVLPRAVFYSLGTAFVVYALGTALMVGVLPAEELSGNLTPVASTAAKLFGEPGRWVLAVAALLAFVSVANAGTMSASRYPLAMGRDHLMPRVFVRLGRRGTPTYAIALTVGLIILVLLTLDVTKIAKLASAFQLLMFAFVCGAVIVWRESKINSYDPGFPSPLYPWMQIFGIGSAAVLMFEMGWLPSLFSGGMVLAAWAWFRFYASHRVVREGAIYHLFERLGRRRYHGLDRELREMLKEKGLREDDPFDEIVARCGVIDLDEPVSFDELTARASELLAAQTGTEAETIASEILQGTRVGATPVTLGVALPHVRLRGLGHAEMVLVRSRPGVVIAPDLPDQSEAPDQRAHAVFYLASPREDPAQHLRILAQLAGRVEEESFNAQWLRAKSDHDLKEVVLRDENFLTLRLCEEEPAAELVGSALRDIELPEGALVAIVRREGHNMVPRGRTVLMMGDRITLIGNADAILELEARYDPE